MNQQQQHLISPAYNLHRIKKIYITQINHFNNSNKMVENKSIPSEYDLNAKWDACLDLGVRRFVYASAAGAFTGLLFFREFFFFFFKLV